MQFAHLHVHSNFSLLQGAMTVREVAAAAARGGMPAVALTDTNGLYGAVEFLQAAREAGVRPVIGAEIVSGSEQCVCLAADRGGYANLCRIVTERKLFGTPHYEEFAARDPAAGKGPARGGDDPARAARHPRQEGCDLGRFDLAACLREHAEGLFFLTATPSLLRSLHGSLPEERLYAELRADESRSFETRCPTLSGVESAGGRAKPGAILADVAERLGVPPAATVNVNFLHPDDRVTHAVVSAIRENTEAKGLVEDGRMLAGRRSHFMSPEQVAARLPAPVRRRAMRNTLRIAERCGVDLEPEEWHFPKADLRPGESACEKLRRVAFRGARRRYGDLSQAVRRRLEKELGVIEKLNFCHYFLVVRDIIEFAEREDIPHVGRGSAANSIVSYCLGISAVCPLKFDLYFERFLNEFRTDVPDIDIDFCWRRRDDVLDYVYRRYGAERVAMVATHSTFRARSAFRDVGRVLGLPLEEINAYSKRLPSYAAESIPEAMETFPEMRDFPIDEEPWRTVVRTAFTIDGYVRHVSIHLGGMVIGDRPLTHYTALENSAKGIVVTQYEMDSIEDIGLVKMDLLGQRSLSIVAEAARDAEKLHEEKIDLDALPDRDPRTGAVLKSGRTMGCFQIESPGMRQLLQMQRAEGITDLIQGLSLIRPGPSSSGMKHAFIRRSRGEEPVEYSTPLLEEALGKTCGVMLYQEDILRVAQSVAGFSLAEGDELRKHISKDRSRQKLEQFREKFVGGAVERGVDRQAADRIWTRIEDFAAYSYCKAHATTYGHISYQAAWLKAHYPAEFLAGVVANKAGFYGPRTHLADARRFNVQIRPPSINHSEVETRPETAEGAPAGAIRPGLEFVNSLSAATMQRILEQRLRGPYRSLNDFHDRVKISRRELENLILCGAFDEMGHTRPTLMMKLEGLRDRSGRGVREPGPLFDRETEPAPRAAEPVAAYAPEQAAFPLEKRVLWELEILGFSHSGHPLDAWNGQLRREHRVPSFELPRRTGERITLVGWLITTRRAVTKNQEYMRFITLEDRHGVVEAVLFPDTYRRCGAQIDGAGCYRVSGKVDEEHGAVNIVADDVEKIPPPDL